MSRVPLFRPFAFVDASPHHHPMAAVQELKAPSFLVAVPQQGDPSFNQALVLLIEHDEKSSFGLIMNQSSELTIGEFCDSHELAWQGERGELVHVGGPVQQERAFLIHDGDAAGEESEAIGEGLWLSYSMESLAAVAKTPPPRCRMYVGYAGWGPGQLEEEVMAGAWLLGKADPGLIFGNQAADLWGQALKDMGIHPSQLLFSGALH